MMNPTNLIKTGSQFLNTNAPAILTAFGAVGVVGTALLTAKATFEAADILREARLDAAQQWMDDNQESLTDAAFAEIQLTKVETFKLVWINYLPAVTTGALSVAAIVMSHRISSRRAAMLAAAYALNEGKLEEYQDKIKEKFGIKKEEETRTELTQDKINREYNSTEKVFSPIDGKVLMREDYTGRFFWSTIDAVNKAVNEVNAHILDEGSARLSDFYDCIGLSHVSTSDYFGWTRDDLLDLDWNTCTTPDGNTAVHSFEYKNHPVMDPDKVANASFR